MNGSLPFLNREQEVQRLSRAWRLRQGSFSFLYGRRRLGKSRLLREVLPGDRSVYFVADERDSVSQREALAQAMASQVPGFADVRYPDWDGLFRRWWADAPTNAILAIDEFPYLVRSGPELPSVLQKWIDGPAKKVRHLVLCGSSQRMMQGLVLDRAAPLFGRANEILHIQPLTAGWISSAFRHANAWQSLEAYGIWGGVPRYWELARTFPRHWKAVQQLVLDPMGVLHLEPTRLLLDDMREITQAHSVLAVIGQGVQRLSEIAGRLQRPSTALTLPLQRLIELGLVRREVPFGHAERGGKRSVYRLADPFLQFWYRFVLPKRSELESGALRQVLTQIRHDWHGHLGSIWECLVRDSISHLPIHGTRWGQALRWWGAGIDRRPLELDLVAPSLSGKKLLIAEVKLSMTTANKLRAEHELHQKIARFPLTQGFRHIVPRVFVANVRDGKRSTKDADLKLVLNSSVPDK